VTPTRPVRPPPAFDRELLAQASIVAARALLGCLLVRDGGARPSSGAEAIPRRAGRIVEVEAYSGPEDRASHARMGTTPRNRVMFGPPGIAYVYLVYGMHHCLNVVTEAEGRPAALLIRAIEPVEGAAVMRAARTAKPGANQRPVPDHRLAAGPGLVGAAFGLDRTMNGLDLCDATSPLHLEPRPEHAPEPVICATPRIGIAFAGEPWTSMPWRLVIADSASLSRASR